jgi:hypothetical protein
MLSIFITKVNLILVDLINKITENNNMSSHEDNLKIVKNLIKSSKPLNEFEKQIILYAKGHYMRTVWKEGSDKTFYDDLAKIIAFSTKIPLKSVTAKQIEVCVVETFLSVADRISVQGVVVGLLDDHLDPVMKLKGILAQIACTKIVDKNNNKIWDIGNPDPSVLPLKK